MLQLLNSRLVAAAVAAAVAAVVGVAELEVERNLVASLEQEIGMRLDMIVGVVGSGAAGWMLRVKFR